MMQSQTKNTASENRPRRVLVACQVFYPDIQSTSQLLTELLTELADNNQIDLTVLCGYPSGLRIGEGKVPKEEKFGNITIRRCGFQVDVKRGMRNRLLAYASFLLGAGWQILRRARSYDVVFGVTNPPFMGILLYFTSLLAGFRYQYMLQDLHPEGLFLVHVMKERSLAARVWVWLNRKAYRRAERLVVLGRDMSTLLQERYGIPADKITYIPHWAAAETPRPIGLEESPFLADWSLSDKFIVQYSGNMGLWHDINTFVRAAKKLEDEKDIVFVFIGGGIRRAPAQALASELGLTNIQWRGFVPRDQLPVSLATCHVSLVTLDQGLEGIAVPCKIYGILASGRAMIAQAPANSEVGLVVREEECGLVVPPGDVDGLVAAIRQLHDDHRQTAAMGQRAAAAYQKKYTIVQAREAFSRLWQI
jgi:glycosyltransferase involved in cell wall biosynthesis